MLKNVLQCVGVLSLLVMLVGCDQAPPKPPEVSDDVYYSDFSVKGQWQVRFSGRVTIEVDTDGVVNVYGISYTNPNNSSSTIRPDVKVSGNAVFKVHNVENVKADDGTTVYVYDSDLVKASHRSNIFAYNCQKVLAVYDVGTIEPHGITKVQKLSGPAPEAAPADGTATKAPANVDPAKKN